MPTDFDQLKAQFDLRSYAAEYIGRATHTHEYDQCACIFHGGTGRTPSLTIYSDHFYCFSCGASGTVIDFVMLYENVDFGRAVEILKEKAPLQEKKQPPPQEKKQISIPMSVVDESFSHIQEGLPYFNSRKITEPTSYVNRLGVHTNFYTAYTMKDGSKFWFTARRYAAPNIFDDKVRAINYRRDDASLMLAVEKHPSRDLILKDLEEQLGHMAERSDVIDYCGGPKYRQEPGSLWRPFNVGLIKRREGKEIIDIPQQYLLLHAESKEYDTLALMDAGYPTVGVQVTADMIPVLPRLFAHIPMLYIIRDMDEPGLKKAARLQEVLGRGRIITPLEGKDSGDTVRAGVVNKWLQQGYGLDPYLR